MRVKKSAHCLFIAFFVFFIFGTAISGYAFLPNEDGFQQDTIKSEKRGEAADAEYLDSTKKDTRKNPDLMQWNMEVDDKTFQIMVNRNEETITIRGEAEDWKQKEKAENVLRLRAPSGFQIINQIDITQPLMRGRG
ncbi:MAG: hypothetical protein AB1847_14545 [bacterium]